MFCHFFSVSFGKITQKAPICNERTAYHCRFKR